LLKFLKKVDRLANLRFCYIEGMGSAVLKCTDAWQDRARHPLVELCKEAARHRAKNEEWISNGCKYCVCWRMTGKHCAPNRPVTYAPISELKWVRRNTFVWMPVITLALIWRLVTFRWLKRSK
jgi:hypothetical protein